jgi:hypothetical protein
MASNTENVSVGRPSIEGAAFIATVGTSLPTDALTALTVDWKNVGYAADSGLTNSVTRETQEIKAWGGDTVSFAQTSFSETYKLNLIECLNPVVLKEIFGYENVIDDGDMLRVAHTASEREYHPWVFDMILGSKVKRVVIPAGKITEVGDVVYSDSTAVGYEITISCRPNAAGETSIEYIEEPA